MAIEPVCCIGAGLVGRAWAIVFASGGRQVRLYDENPVSVVAARDFAAAMLPDLSRAGLLADDPEMILSRIVPADTLEAALDGAVHVQESTPERLDIKTGVFARLDRLAPEGATLASSSSALLPSSFTETLPGRDRCLVVHPINPPYLIPAVEVVPAPWTAPETVLRTADLLRGCGMNPIVMRRELDGFIMNRMQGALLEEAFRLVADGYATAEDIDIGIRDGLALRWSFMGPFETIDLNAPGGIRDYAERYQGIYENVFPSMQRRVDWAGPVMDAIETARRARLPATDLAGRQTWRDRRLMALAAHKRKADREIGE